MKCFICGDAGINKGDSFIDASKKKKLKKKKYFASIPPTERAVHQDSLKAYLQVQV